MAEGRAADPEDIKMKFENDMDPEVWKAYRNTTERFVKNWIVLKENSNATTWKNKFLKRNLLSERDIKAFGENIKRSELAEWLIMKVLQKVKKLEDIAFIDRVVCNDVKSLRRQEKTEDASPPETTEQFAVEGVTLSNNRGKIAELLSREDAITIKDHLVQDRIITLTENEYLLTQEKHVLDKKNSLITGVMDTVIGQLHKGSYQCLTQSLETISNKKRQQQIVKILKNVSVTDAIKSDMYPTRTQNMKSTFYDKEIDGKTDFQMTIKAIKSSREEAEEVYPPITENPDTLDTIFITNLAVSAGKISKGSLVINFQMMEKNMQDYIKHCLRNGNVTTVVQMLFSEISIDYVDPSGELLLEVKIEINEDADKFESDSENSSEMKFMLHNQSFLIEEMDTDAMIQCLRKHRISISQHNRDLERVQKASLIIDYIKSNHLEDMMILIIKDNENGGFGYILQRLETYETVYTTDSSCLKKNLLLQFSLIVSEIDIYDIQDTLIERHTGIDEKCLYRIGNCMATLLLNILKYGDALRAFVDALFIMEWSSAEKMLRWQSQVYVVERDSEVEICENSSEDNLLFEGSFKVFIDDRVVREIRLRNCLNKERQGLRNEMIQFQNTLLEWRSDALLVIETLKVLADELNVHFSRISKSKIGGSAAGIIGGVLSIVGLSLAPITFGASLGLSIAGGVVAALGGATVGGSLIADTVLSEKTKTKADTVLTKYSDSSGHIKAKCSELSSKFEKHGMIEVYFPDWVKFWKHFVHGQNSNTNDFEWKETQDIINLKELSTTFILGEGLGAGVRITGAAIRVTGTSLHVLSGIVGALMIPLDIFTILDSAIDLHKENKHGTSKSIIEMSEAIANEIPTEEKIKTMIRHTILTI